MKERRLIRLPEVRHLVGLGTTAIYSLIAESKFPQQIRLTDAGAVAWDYDEVQCWIAERLERSREPLPRGRKAASRPELAAA